MAATAGNGDRWQMSTTPLDEEGERREVGHGHERREGPLDEETGRNVDDLLAAVENLETASL